MLRWNVCAAAPGLAVALLALAPVAAAHPAAPAQEQTQDQAARLDALIERWDQAEKAFYEKYRAAETNEERRALMDQRPKPADYLPEAVEIAEQAAGTEVAARAWMWALSHLDPQDRAGELAEVAIEALMRDHMDSPEVAELPMMLMYVGGRSLGDDKVEALLRDMVARAPQGALQGNAMFALASVLDSDELDPESERGKEVRGLMEAVAKGYADVKDSRGRSIGARAEGWIFEKDHLQVGKAAPEIEGTDLSGVAFKLSDYRGKVVLLDFWGNW
jgi:hypothetical protein